LATSGDHELAIDIVGELTPWFARTVRNGGTSFGPTPQQFGFTVHGAIPVQPWNVTFLDCRTTGRSGNALTMIRRTHAHQVVQANWAVAGAHVMPEDTYRSVRLQVTGLEEWARTPGLSQQMRTQSPLGTTLSWTQTDDLSAPFDQVGQQASDSATEATISCSSSATFTTINVHGGRIDTSNWLTLTGLTGWTLEEIVARFAVPLQTLMTLLTGARARVRRLEIQVDELWCPVFGHLIEPEDSPAGPKPRPETIPILLDHRNLDLDCIARWCATTIDTEAIALAISAEGMDRRLHRDDRRFNEATVDTAREQLRTLELDPQLKQVLSSSLSYIHEPSMPQRVARLAESVSAAAPGCIGRANRWKRGIVDMRNAAAHGFERAHVSRDEEVEALFDLYALARSLRWALRLRLLQLCGVADNDLSSALDAFEEYQRDERRWRARLPRIFPTED
jgi:ApeA N-terminal domain 1